MSILCVMRAQPRGFAGGTAPWLEFAPNSRGPGGRHHVNMKTSALCATLLALALTGCAAQATDETTVAAAAQPAAAQPSIPDPYLWLEDVEGQRALDWVHAENARS